MQNNLMNNPDFLAALIQAEGKPNSQAMSDAAIIAYNRQQVQARQQEQAQAQFMAQRLPQVLHELANKNPYEAAATLAAAGMRPEDIGLLLERLGKGTSKSDLVTGPGGFKYEEFINPSGHRELREVPGQTARQSYEEQKAEQKELERKRKETSKRLEEMRQAAIGARKSSEAIQQGKEAFEKLDKNTYWGIEPGSTISALTDPSVTPKGGFADAIRRGFQNFIYNNEAVEAQDKIAKLNSHLTQELAKEQSSRFAQTDAGKKLLSQGLPQGNIKANPRNDVLKGYEKDFGDLDARYIFTEKWVKAHNGIDDGADEAYEDFKVRYHLFDQNGVLNRKALKKIDDYIYGIEGASDEEWEAEARRRNFK